MGTAHSNRIIRGEIPGMKLAAVCDVAPNLQTRFPDQAVFSDPEEMFRSGAIDAVIIATPHYSHTTLGVGALTAGLHVLVEKPISVHKADCERLLAAPRKPGQLFGAMFNMRTRPVYRKLKQLIDAGELGEVRRIHWTITDWFRTKAYYDSGTWRGTWAGEGGGVLLNQCPHQLDLWQWLFGMPNRIYARCTLGRYHDIEVEDDVTAILEYEGGKTGVFTTSTGEAPGTNRLEIAGEMGRIVVENEQIQFLRNEVGMTEYGTNIAKGMSERPPVWKIEIPVPEKEGQEHAEITRNFSDAILKGVPLVAPAEEGINSVEIGNAILLSSLLDKAIDIPMDSAVYEKELQKLIEKGKKL